VAALVDFEDNPGACTQVDSETCTQVDSGPVRTPIQHCAHADFGTTASRTIEASATTGSMTDVSYKRVLSAQGAHQGVSGSVPETYAARSDVVMIPIGVPSSSTTGTWWNPCSTIVAATAATESCASVVTGFAVM